MKLIDTHCHLYLDEFRNDINNVIDSAKSIGVEKFFFPAIDSSHINSMLHLEKSFPDVCFAMIGLHPCSVKDNFKNELKIAVDWLKKRNFAAIGEIGLDFYWDKKYTIQQYKAFETQVHWALELNMPIVIHTRNAMHETIEFLKPFISKGLKGIFHCFSGTEKDAMQIIEMGFYLGIGGVVTYKNAGLAEALKNIDLNYMVLETDAPYLTPVPFRGKRNESSYIKYIAEKLAAIKYKTVEEVALTTTANAEKIFNRL